MGVERQGFETLMFNLNNLSMKKLFALFAAAAMLSAGGCGEYDDSELTGRMDNLEDRVEKLEKLCQRMNNDISSLQTIVTALQNNDYVTGVVPVTKNGETIGYTIAFTKSAPVTIYHGEDGKDGANGSDGKDGVNGADGHTPVIGVRRDTDGIYYWTLDGDWLLDGSGNKIKAEGRDGTNGQDGSDGKDGVNGTDGENGKDGSDGKDGRDGITPQLKIENGYWFVSTDGGANWTNLGKATGEDGKDGTNGKDGADGDSMFSSVTQDEDNVYLTLQITGEVITLPKKRSLAISFDKEGDLLFSNAETITLQYTITGSADEYIVKADMLNTPTYHDEYYTLHTASTSATTGTIEISSPATPEENRLIITVSDGSQTIMAAFDVAPKPSIQEVSVTVTSPGTLRRTISAICLMTDIRRLTISGSLNNADINCINRWLSKLSFLDMGDANMENAKDLKITKSVQEVILPKTLTAIPNVAFYDYTSLKSITLPEGLTSIGSEAFMYCWSLQSINLPESLTSIGAEAFFNCNKLTSFILPESLTSVGYNAFEASGLKSIYCKAQQPPKVGTSGRGSAPGISKCVLYVPRNCKDVYAASAWNEAKSIEEFDF